MKDLSKPLISQIRINYEGLWKEIQNLVERGKWLKQKLYQRNYTINNQPLQK